MNNWYYLTSNINGLTFIDLGICSDFDEANESLDNIVPKSLQNIPNYIVSPEELDNIKNCIEDIYKEKI